MQYERMEAKYNSEKVLRESVLELIDALSDDPTPEADSSFDPVWDYLRNRGENETVLTMEDISSRFNLNFIRTKMIEKSSFKNLMIGGFSPEDLKLYRGENGFFTNLNEGYKQFFEEEDLNQYFTAFSYANVNVTYEDSLKKIYEIRVSEAGSFSFLNEIQQLISGKTLVDNSGLKELLGTNYEILYPLINTRALMNVNFVDEKILSAVLNYPYGDKKHENSAAFLETIKAERSVFEIEKKRLKELLPVEEDYLRILEYIGTTTWFWRIKAKSENLTLDVVLCRYPGEATDTVKRDYQILQWNYY